MCGFVCVINRNRNFPGAISKNVLNHRGPDHTSQITHGCVSMRHWRLSIVDLNERSNQPIDRLNNLFMYNGEIYDFKKISKYYFNKIYKSDTLFFLDMLLEGKRKELKNLSGFYSYVLLDKQKQVLEGGRDIWGKKPLYYYIDDKQAIFSSEEQGIISILNQNTKINKESLLNYIIYKNTFFGQSYFQNIREISPGGSFFFDIKNWKFSISLDWNHYYSIPFKEMIDSSFVKLNNENDISLDLITLLEESVKNRFKCDVPVQLALSGGVDSASIASIISFNPALRKKLLRALTVKFDHEKDESVKALQISNKLNIKHYTIDFSNFDFLNILKRSISFYAAPLEHPHSLAYYVLCSEVSNQGKVLVTGEGADELLFGYNHYNMGFTDSFAFRPFLELSKYFSGDLNFISSLFIKQRALRVKALSSMHNSRDLEIKTHLLSLLRRNDRMSMANSVEIRAPFLDIKLAYNILNRLTYNNLNGSKIYLNNYLKNKLPSFKSEKEKIGFYVPFDKWFNLNKKNDDVKSIINRATSFISDEYKLKIFRTDEIDGRLGWVLCNIGVFLETFNS